MPRWKIKMFSPNSATKRLTHVMKFERRNWRLEKTCHPLFQYIRVGGF
jgi:hypothetical protein